MSTVSTLSHLQELLPQLFQNSTIKGDRYLRFGISQLSALIPMNHIQESLLIANESITPIPQMPSAVMGLASSRNAVFCIFDLGHLMGLYPLSSYLRQYHVIVLKESTSDLLIGVAVHQIQGVTRVIPEEICRNETVNDILPQKKLPLSLKPYFTGSFRQDEDELLILDLSTLFSHIKQSK